MPLFKKYFSIVKKTKPEIYVFGASLVFYISLYFNLNNKTLLGLFFIFLLVFWYKLKNFLVVLFILYLLFLPFGKGKTFNFILIPAQLIDAGVPFTYDFTINFADLAFLGLFFLILKNEVIDRYKNKKVKLIN